jgi:hypothetical protein
MGHGAWGKGKNTLIRKLFKDQLFTAYRLPFTIYDFNDLNGFNDFNCFYDLPLTPDS